VLGTAANSKSLDSVYARGKFQTNENMLFVFVPLETVSEALASGCSNESQVLKREVGGNMQLVIPYAAYVHELRREARIDIPYITCS